MSGRDYNGGGGGAFTDVDACDKLTVNTHISSPKEAVVSKLKVDDRLDVTLDDSGQYATVVLLFEGRVAGGIATPQISALIRCLRGGSNYLAEVKSVNDGQVKIRITPVRSESA